MKRAALYIRVSTDEQARHGLSLGEQRADLERYANAHHYTIVGIYADEGSTARKSLKRRKELQRLLDDVRAGRIDIILFKCLDRWFRNIRDYYKVQDILDEHGVDWECTQEKYNTTTTSGRLMLNIKLSVAQNESDQTSDRIRYVNEGKIRRREALGGHCAFGYSIKDKHYAIIPEQAEAVRYIFDRVIAGDSLRQVVRAVNREYGFPLSFRRMCVMLRNETYIGTYHGIKEYHEPIVSKDVFERVQKVLASHPKTHPVGRVYLFRGKLICPDCGSIMIGHQVVRKGTFRGYDYRCPKHFTSGIAFGEGRCKYGGAVTEKIVERYLVKNLAKIVDGYMASFHQGVSTKTPDFETQKKNAEGRLARLKELYIDGMIERPDFDNRAAGIQHEIDDLDLKLLQAQQISPAVKDILTKLDGFEDGYSILSRESKYEFWQRLIKRIELGEPPKIARHGYNDFRISFA